MKLFKLELANLGGEILKGQEHVLLEYIHENYGEGLDINQAIEICLQEKDLKLTITDLDYSALGLSNDEVRNILADLHMAGIHTLTQGDVKYIFNINDIPSFQKLHKTETGKINTNL